MTGNQGQAVTADELAEWCAENEVPYPGSDTAESSDRQGDCVTDRDVEIARVESREQAFFVARLWHHYFGTHHDTEEPRLPIPLAQCLDWCEELSDAAAFVATHQNVRVAGAIATILDHDTVCEELPDGDYNRDAIAGERNGWLEFSAVDPSWRGLGIGRDLFRRRLKWFQEEDVEMVFGYGWERDRASSRELFAGFGFEPIQQFRYDVSSERNGCPDCGVWQTDDEPCTCPYTLWALDIGANTV